MYYFYLVTNVKRESPGFTHLNFYSALRRCKRGAMSHTGFILCCICDAPAKLKKQALKLIISGLTSSKWGSTVYFDDLPTYLFNTSLRSDPEVSKDIQMLANQITFKGLRPQSSEVLLIPSFVHKDPSWRCVWSPDCSFWHYQKRWIPAGSTSTSTTVIRFS